MRIAILNSDYPRFLLWLYTREPQLADATYSQQLRARTDTLFGTADFYSRAFEALGHEATEFYVNNCPLQAAWAREQGLLKLAQELSADSASPRLPTIRRLVAPLRPYLKPLAHRLRLAMQLTPSQRTVLRLQLEAFRPDIIFNQDAFYVDAAFLQSVKASTGASLVCYLGKPLIGSEIFGYDLVVALLSSVVALARQKGVRAMQSPLAFDPSVLSAVGSSANKDIEVSFVGTVSEEHLGRIKMLEAVASRFDLRFFGTGLDTLSKSSPLRACWGGEVWGREMYEALHRSKITLNSHIDAVSTTEAGNMRLYEATGVGTFLLTDWRELLHELYEPNRHLATWRTPIDCVECITHYLSRDDEREAIARSGQEHTLANHTYGHRARGLIEQFSLIT